MLHHFSQKAILRELRHPDCEFGSGKSVIPTNASSDSTLVVLYIEDDALTRRSVSNRLQRRGVTVLAAESGEQALELVADRPALSAVLLDIDLPGIDGLETFVRLQENYPRLPVVICSGALSSTVLGRIKRMGISQEHCLCKPCRFHDVLTVVENVVSGQGPGQ